MNSTGYACGKYLVLSGGVGGAKLVLGLTHVLSPEALCIVVNSGDDFIHHGLYISPDIDTLIYTLADINNKELGWGRSDETWNYMQACEALGLEHWFRLGDKDLAIHIYRTQRIAQGAAFSEVVAELCSRCGVSGQLVPMSDDPVRTFVDTEIGRLPFQEYFVKHGCAPVVCGIEFDGQGTAKPTSGFSAALSDEGLRGVIVAPSNPFLSIDPIISLADVRQRLSRIDAPCIVVSPIVQGQALKGPTAKLMHELGLNCDVASIADHYADFADGIIIDTRDASYIPAIEARGLRVLTTNIIMKSLPDKIRLAQEAMGFAHDLSVAERQ